MVSNLHNISTIMSNKPYRFQKTNNERWGIYLQGRLLATVGSYELCQYIEKMSSKQFYFTDNLKAQIAYKQVIHKSLMIK